MASKGKIREINGQEDQDLKKKVKKILCKLLDDVENCDDPLLTSQVVRSVIDFLKIEQEKEGQFFEEEIE